MSKFLYKHRFLISRRVVQIAILFLYLGANLWGWNILVGNLSTSLVFGVIPLSDPLALLQMFAAGAVIAFDILVGALIVTLFYLGVGGRVFCSFVCPVNMITDLSNYIRRKSGINSIQKRQPSSRSIRYWVLFLTLLLSFILGVGAFELVSPIGMVHRGVIFGFGFGIASVIAIFLFDLFVLKNGWCGHICPLGAFYSIVGKGSIIRVEHDKDSCTLCMKCKEVCPESQVLSTVGKQSAQILSGECINCGRCVEVCDDDALSFSIRKQFFKRDLESTKSQ